MENCKICDKEETPETIGCDRCNGWFHFDCVKLSQDNVDRIINYYCDSCEEEHGLMTTWRSDKPTKAQKEDKRKNYYEVEKIVRHRLMTSGRWFFVKWKGYNSRHNSWEPEKNLNGCLDILQKYLKDNGLELSSMKGLIGASENDDFNANNWVDMETVLKILKRFRKRHFKGVSLEIAEFDSFGNKDGIYLFNSWHHGYVLLYLHEKKLAYIADGRNLFREDINIARELKDWLGIRLISKAFDQQLHVDDCGSSAVLIGLEFLRMYRTGIFHSEVKPYISLANEVRKHFKAKDSKKIPTDGKKNLIAFIACSLCNRRFKTRRQAVSHEMMCKKKHNI